MDTQSSARIALLRILAGQQVAHEAQAAHGGIHVHDDLVLTKSDISWLPDNLRVDGSLYLDAARIWALPEGLHVQGDLNVSQTPITEVPGSLRVGGYLNLSYCPLRCLPAHLSVPGALDLRHSALRTLPEHLHVGGKLFLWGTAITRLPSSLRVDDTIGPPEELQDIVNFMATQERSAVVLSLRGSHHQAFTVRTQLQAFPDVWTLLVACGHDHVLRIRRCRDNTFSAYADVVR